CRPHHSRGLHSPQPNCRCALHPRQSTAEGLVMTAVSMPTHASEEGVPFAPVSLWSRLRRRKSALLGLAVIAALVLLAVFAPLIAPYDPDQTNWALIRKPPSWQHWLGTDESGRDLLSRVIFGGRASLLAGLVSVCIAAGLGIPLGLYAGFRE